MMPCTRMHHNFFIQERRCVHRTQCWRISGHSFYSLDIHCAALLKISEQGFTLWMSTTLHFCKLVDTVLRFPCPLHCIFTNQWTWFSLKHVHWFEFFKTSGHFFAPFMFTGSDLCESVNIISLRWCSLKLLFQNGWTWFLPDDVH